MEIQGQFVPKKLVAIKPPIKGLWWRGNLELLESNKIVAIVGSRKMSQYGRRVLEEIVPKLVEAGYVTISGFMYGIDIEMHRLTMENGGKTIGVFGWGIDAPIIPENIYLYNKIIESDGLFLSELEPKQLGTLWTFPLRNRIVVGLSDMVVVVEAGIKSGSLNSAEWARKLGKPVYAVPGSIFSSVSMGCNLLLDKGVAKPLTLEFFQHKYYSKKGRINPTKSVFSNDESILITQLRLEGPQSVNELSRALSISVEVASSMLMRLMLEGELEEEKGMWKVS